MTEVDYQFLSTLYRGEQRKGGVISSGMSSPKQTIGILTKSICWVSFVQLDVETQQRLHHEYFSSLSCSFCTRFVTNLEPASFTSGSPNADPDYYDIRISGFGFLSRSRCGAVSESYNPFPFCLSSDG